MASCDPTLQARFDRLSAQRSAQSPFGGPGGAQYIVPGESGCPDDCIGDHLYGFDSGAVLLAVGVATNIVTEPQLRNQPRRLFLTETIADGFIIRDIRVGVMPLLATTGPISAACFTPAALVPNFKRLICEVNQQVTVEVENIGAVPARFIATMSAYIVG